MVAMSQAALRLVERGACLPQVDPEGNLRWLWVPHADWLDEQGFFRVQCYFRVYEHGSPPRLVCEGFRTVRAMSAPEVDRADGTG